MNKFDIEKVLHEIIRDLPAAEKASRLFDNGYITFDDALRTIADIYREEMRKCN